MRGEDNKQPSMLCLTSPSARVPQGHPIRVIKELADSALARLSRTFDKMYSHTGRPSIPPERLLKATLLMALYSVRSERQFCEQLDYNLLFRWFLDIDMLAPSFDPTSFGKNRDRLLEHDVAAKFFHEVVSEAKRRGLVSEDHFSVDGTLIEAWASLKSFRPKGDNDGSARRGDRDGTRGSDSNPWMNFRGEKRKNDTHESKTDPESRLMRKSNGREAKLSFYAHALMENRNGLLADLRVTEANGRAEVTAGLEMLRDLVRRRRRRRRVTVGADKGYDTHRFVDGCRALKVTPHVAQNIAKTRGSNIDRRTVRHAGYKISQTIRRRIEEPWGWAKTTGNFRRSRYRGRARTQFAAFFVGAAYNLMRIARLVMA